MIPTHHTRQKILPPRILPQMLLLSVLTAAAAQPRQGTLDNGLTVTVVADLQLPHLVVQHWITSGSASDPLTKPGLAHLVEHLVVRDSGLEETVDALGGSLSAYTAPDYTRFTVEIGREHLAQTLRILTPVPISEATLASARRVVREELAQRSGYTARLRAAVDVAYWQAHPYANAASWMLVEPDTLTAADCAGFISAHYRPEQTHLIVVGPLDADDVFATAAEHYGARRGEVVEPAPVSHTPPEQVRLKTGPAAVRLAGLIWPLPPTGHPDQPALQLALHLLPASAPSLMSGALSAGGHVSWGRTGSRLLLSGVYSALRSDERIASDLALTASATAQWLTEARLESTRARLIRKTLGHRLDASALARGLGWSAVMRGEVDTIQSSVERLESLTLAEVEAAWTRWIAAADPVEVLADVD